MGHADDLNGGQHDGDVREHGHEEVHDPHDPNLILILEIQQLELPIFLFEVLVVEMALSLHPQVDSDLLKHAAGDDGVKWDAGDHDHRAAPRVYGLQYNVGNREVDDLHHHHYI